MLHANNRKRKLHIPTLLTRQGLSSNHQQKEEAIYEHFVKLLGQTQERTLSLNWTHLGYQPHDLQELEAAFDDSEIKKIVMQMPTEKSPGPDGFIGLFYRKCWSIVGNDLCAAVQAFHSQRTRRIELINEANIVLLPKKEGATDITDFRPISLINNLAKIITKLLADRLAPRMNELVSSSQNAFIKK